ncbi:bifunctional DNA-formamidopyrimidine glycosylase/DNA-(apurinic or apyrimidinic site) lyase [Candidatus Saccharibacteria bacterium]|nr:bifunctional DNA-formamidopyrimidine glycosylase/DNA-(apurinic or apyrimidinic site) lyase [Candidatus Saccharibacteria bacterium]
MPELPEVETIRRGLEGLIVGRKITAAVSDTPKSFPNAAENVEAFLVGAAITGVRRRAKVLLIDLSTNYSLVIHLKMTGQLVYVDASARFGAGHPNESLIHSLPDRSTRVTFGLAPSATLYFNDQRKFGWVRLMPTAEVPSLPFMLKVGPEPLEAAFTPDVFMARFSRRPRAKVKAALLDQTVIAGVGNIYADESLWLAQIHPQRLVGSLSKDELSSLYSAVREVMNLSIEKGGSTDKNYVAADGRAGTYLQHANVFRKEGTPCPRCGAPIIKTKVAGRGTHVCTVCQSEPK